MGAIFLSNSEEESFEINSKAPRDNMFYKLEKRISKLLSVIISKEYIIKYATTVINFCQTTSIPTSCG